MCWNGSKAWLIPAASDLREKAVRERECEWVDEEEWIDEELEAGVIEKRMKYKTSGRELGKYTVTCDML
jgi:hypothetical protein